MLFSLASLRRASTATPKRSGSPVKAEYWLATRQMPAQSSGNTVAAGVGVLQDFGNVTIAFCLAGTTLPPSFERVFNMDSLSGVRFPGAAS